MTTTAPKKARPKDWHPRAVQGALEDKGYTLAKLANEYGLSNCASLSRAIRHGSKTGEKRIADALGIHPKEIWPSRYHDNGERKLEGFRAIQFNRFSAGCNGKKQATA